MLNMSKGPLRGPDPDLPLIIFWGIVIVFLFFLR